MNFTKNLHWIICSLFLCSCARQSAPTGGPKDTIPPVVVKTIPQNEAINFKGKELQLLFSEDVILNTPKEQLIITPAIGKDYKITYRKNIVTLTFDQPLKDSTTYTFNFRDAVQDITEKNPVKNLQLALSTGSYIDSLSISGTIYDLLRGKVIEDATAALHTENDTFSIFEDPTVIFTKTSKQGTFKISHLKPDKYFIYAINDKNRNLVVNSRTEAYGFISGYQQLTDTVGNINIGLVRLDATPLKLTSARPYNTYFNIRANKNLRTFDITATDSSDLSFTFGENNANIRVYKTTEKDSLAIHLVAQDSLDNRIDTTLYAKYLTRQVTPEKFDVSIPTSSLLVDRGLLKATILFTKPIGEIDFDSIFFQVDSLNKITFTPQDLLWDPLLRKMTIEKTFDRALYPSDEATTIQGRPARSLSTKAPKSSESRHKPNQLILGKGAFLSIENDSSKHIAQSMTPMREADLSVINIEIRTTETSFLVQLLDNNYKVVQQQQNKPKVTFSDITPGDYQIRLIIDSNSNGRWDPGNYFKDEEPEKIIYYRSPDGTTSIKGVKANWEIGTDGEMFITY
ncbi:MAG TPA: Ig-like domain-containing protein [Chryseosolibacter sp.]|nr:Ig-like domain-containing protein [Chryseosolibacter sp.]